MSKHVILLTDAHEAPAYELIEALSVAGVETLIEGLRDAEVEASMSRLGLKTHSEQIDQQPIAVLYEVISSVDMVELHAAIEHATTTWPGTPLVACRRQLSGFAGASFLGLDGATLKRLGFRAIADKAAQLPAILREIEGHGVTGELKLPDIVLPVSNPESTSLPMRVKRSSLRAAFDLVSSLHFIGDQNGAAHTALAGLVPLVHADRWAIYLVNESKGAETISLDAIASRTPSDPHDPNDPHEWRRRLIGANEFLAGAETKTARLAATGVQILKKKEGSRYVVAVPLVCGERVLGVLEGIRDRAFRKSEIGVLDSLSRPIASALANAVRISEAERLSQTDDLTKLHNARYLRQFLLNEIRRARRYGSSVAALFLDLDNFKQVNDVHGHLAGSHVLMEMAAVILSSIRDTDAVARYGGDEFVIVLPDTGIDLAGAVADRIRNKISNHSFSGGRNLKLALTASFGVAAFPQHASSPQQLIACADTAMYEAKAANKNCIRLSTALGRDVRLQSTVALPADVVETDDENAFS